MRVRAIDFVEISVADMDRAVRFYRDTLGMDFPLWDDSAAWKEFDSPPLALALDRSEGAAPGQVALALAVDDVAAALEELGAKGVPVVYERRESRVCFQAAVRAPDGNVLILHQRKDGSAG